MDASFEDILDFPLSPGPVVQSRQISETPNREPPQDALSRPRRSQNAKKRAEPLDEEEDWTQVEDMAERRKIQNRNAQRTYRKRKKRPKEKGATSPSPRRSPLGSMHNRIDIAREHDAADAAATTVQRPASQLSNWAQEIVQTGSGDIGIQDPNSTTSIRHKPEGPDLRLDTSGPASDHTFSDIDFLGSNNLDFLGLEHGDFDNQNTTTSSRRDTHVSTSPYKRSFHEPGPSQSNVPLKPRSALQLALDNNHFGTVKILLKSNPNMAFHIYKGRTVMYHVMLSDQDGLLQDLLHLRDVNGRTLLHIAVEEEDQTALDRLLQAGADLECKDHAGRTPLHLAGMNGQESIVKFLILRGADVHAKVES
ncbi:hypothetical protein B9Z65_8338 [Elsinoe australis]|uniref:BZIP domain-containing protein n=1 Tax=Elsinoe australis TaxID=40998 RepID=A0A2P7YDG8_9PEZI|nr:hypothetical protein B9Z65_8338 [Elsinoe australis]